MTIFLRMICFVAGAAVSTLPAEAVVRDMNPSEVRAEGLSGNSITHAELDRLLVDAMARHKVPGAQMVIVNRGKIVYSSSQGLSDVATHTIVTDRTLFEVASLSKPLFGMFVMTFVERGQLDLDKPLYDYLPLYELADHPFAKKITARMVLTHKTGLPNWRSESTKGLHFSFEPGTGFRYSGEGYEYLARVLARIAKTDLRGLDRLFVQRVSKPLGLEDIRFFLPDAARLRLAAPHIDGNRVEPEPRSDNFGAAYSVHSTARQYASWAIALTEGQKVLKHESFAAYFAPQSVPIPIDDPQRAIGLSDWALGFSIYQLPQGLLYAHGGSNKGFTSMVAISRDRKWAAVLFTNADQATPFILEMFGSLVA
ncbi:MAG: beta-lactamase family protein [Sphingomonadaceae bacterium]|nr:beta-lactamase family protein [Sphingomonadaceae bacterium]